MQRGCRVLQRALAQQQVPTAAADLSPQHCRADAGEEQGADAVCMRRTAQQTRVAGDVDAILKLTDRILIDRGDTGTRLDKPLQWLRGQYGLGTRPATPTL